MFPFLSVACAGAVFLIHAVVNVVYLHRDVGIGDGFDCPLPNGYALTFIDTTEFATLYNPRGQPLWSDVRENATNDIRTMQLAGRYVLGGVDSQRVQHFGQASSAIDLYFLLDTRTGKRQDFSSYETVREAAQKVRVQVRLIPVADIYSEYRFTWFDGIAAISLFGLPIVGAVILFRRIMIVRRGRPITQPA
jgi:hypothetical protein